MPNGPRITRRYVLFDGTSAQSSTYTSNPILVADFTQMNLSVLTKNTGASLHTVWSSSEDGLTASITTWSAVSTIDADGSYDVDCGMRWLRATRSSIDSLSMVDLQGKY